MEKLITNKQLFKSPAFFKKYPINKNTYEINHEKIFILLLFLVILSISTITLFTCGYVTTANITVIPNYEANGELHWGLDSASPIYYNQQPLHQSFRTMRAIGLVCISWWLMVQIWIIKLGVNMINNSNFINSKHEKVMGYLYCFSWTTIYTIGLLIYEVAQIKKMKLLNYVKSGFNNLSLESFTFNTRKHWTYYYACGALIIMLPLVWFILFPRVDLNDNLVFLGTKTGYNTNWWFFTLQFFTEQTNLMCFFTLLAYVINPKWKAFKNYDLWVVTIAYIVIVSLTYNLAIFPVIASSYKNEPYDLSRTLWLHVVDPITFVSTGCCLFFHNQTKKITPWGNTLKYGMVVPSVYSIYALASPYVTSVSPYAYLTNTNPDLIINNIHGSWWCLLFFTIFMGFFVGFITLWWFTNAKLSIKKYSLKNKELIWIN